MRGSLVVAVFTVLAITAAGCEDGTNITFKNETGSDLTIWRGVVKVVDLRPGGSETYSIGHFPGTTTYKATSSDGVLLYERTLTFEELEALGEIVVRDPPSGTPPTNQ
jgi:hypothetical protein